MSDGINESLWEFPCEHNFKVMGLSKYPLSEVVAEVVSIHAPDFDATRITIKNSSSGKYLSVTAYVQVENKQQLEAIYIALDKRIEVYCTL
jgi:putative lipoic acid-binding regulatory protein